MDWILHIWHLRDTMVKTNRKQPQAEYYLRFGGLTGRL